MRARVLSSLLMAAAFLASPAVAFDGAEHKHVSATGLQLALRACAADPACRLDEKLLRQVEPFADPHSRLEYGTLVSSVDYRLNPLQLMQTAHPQRNLPSAPSELDPHLLNVLTSGGSWFLRAAAANDTHFQGELIAGIRHFHAYAVDVAAHDRNLFAALLLNSIADHFLQDFFAPGHIVTPRFGLHDAAAMGLHNRYNSIGSTFVVDEARFNSDLAGLLEMFLETAEGRRFCCMAPFLPSDPIPLWGDTDLGRSRRQELLMILIAARSILDVLQSASSGSPTNSLRDVKWVPTAVVPNTGRTQLAGGELPYGRYEHLGKDVAILNAGAILAFSAGAHVLRVGGSTRSRTIYQGDWIIMGRPPLEVKRNPTDLDTPAIAHFRDRSWSMRVGYVYEHSERDIARGPAVRVVYAKPLIHMQLSADAAWKTYLQDERHGRKLAYGLRAQTGFSILNFDLGIGRDYSWTLGRLQPALATRFGLTVAGPLSSIPYVGRIEKAIFRWQRRRLEKEAHFVERAPRDCERLSGSGAAASMAPCN